MLYVVRNTFKAHGILYEVGSIIEDPTSIKLFRSRLGVRDVIELSEKTPERQRKMWFEYLQARSRKPLDQRIIEICNGTTTVAVEDKPKTEVVKPVRRTASKEV